MGVLRASCDACTPRSARGEADPLPALPIQYADYAAWQRQLAARPAAAAAGCSTGVQHLHGAPELVSLPTDRPRPAQQDYAGAASPVELDAALTQALKALSRRHGTTLYMTLLAAWAAVVARLAGQDRWSSARPVANRAPRRGRAADRLLRQHAGAAASTSASSPASSELLAQSPAPSLQAQEHQDVPFEQVVEALKPARSAWPTARCSS